MIERDVDGNHPEIVYSEVMEWTAGDIAAFDDALSKIFGFASKCNEEDVPRCDIGNYEGIWCDICRCQNACARTNGYFVCSEGCSDEADTLHPKNQFDQ